jgi:sugar fermentation stimulation protein A
MLAHSWELVEVDLGGGRELVGINTAYPNLIVAEALAEARIRELAGYERVRREVKYGRNSRVDFVLEGADRAPCYLEVKNVHLMRRPGLAEFPDSVTARGARHLDELAAMVRADNRAVMLFLVQIASATGFTLARDIDPAYGLAFDRARQAGVEAIAYRCAIAHHAIVVTGPVPILA